jgi:hypothetical protein
MSDGSPPQVCIVNDISQDILIITPFVFKILFREALNYQDIAPTVLFRNNLTENAFGTRSERVRQCAPFAFHSCSFAFQFAFPLLPERIP